MLETLKHFDRLLFHFINHDLSNRALDVICPVLREKLVWIPFYCVITFYFFKLYGQKALYLSVPAAITIVLSDQISSSIIKPCFHRLRPCNNPEMATTVHLLLHNCGAGYSFVSSHAANHFAIAVFFMFLLPYKKRAVPLLFLWASIVAFSQVYVGVHYPADIFGGALLGIAIGAITGYTTLKFVLMRTQLSAIPGV